MIIELHFVKEIFKEYVRKRRIMGKEVEEGAFEKSCKGNGKDKVNVVLHIHVSKQGKRGRS